MDYTFKSSIFMVFSINKQSSYGATPMPGPTSDLQRFAELRRHQDDFLLLLHPRSDEPEMSQATWD